MAFTFIPSLSQSRDAASAVNDFISNKTFITSKKSDDEVVNIAGIEAICRISDEIQETTDITQTTLEDGSIISDNFINQPSVLTLTGIISNTFQNAEPPSNPYTAGKRSTGLIQKYAPNFGSQVVSKQNQIQSQVTNQIDKVADVRDDATDMVNTFNNSFSDEQALTQMQNKMRQLNAIRKTGQLIKIETPYRVYESMAIVSINHTHDNVDKDSAKFTITAQEVRFAESIKVKSQTVADSLTGNASSELGGQPDSQITKGVQEGISQPTSLLSDLFS